MAKTEDIEAKLAAFVDGELDEAGRAEIEKHLVANPQHRELIAELAQQRDLLMGLPRASAPADIAETINAQLERSALLGNVEDEVEAANMRISRWPQIRAIAAVLMLVLGLAAVIWALLPSPNHKPVALSGIPLPPPESTDFDTMAKSEKPDLAKAGEETGGMAPSTVPSRGWAGKGGSPENFTLVASAAKESDQERRAKDALAVGVTVPEMSKIASNAMPPAERLMGDALANQMKAPGGSGGVVGTGNAEAATPVVVVVSADDPVQADAQVTEYLSRNNIYWQRAAAPGSRSPLVTNGPQVQPGPINAQMPSGQLSGTRYADKLEAGKQLDSAAVQQVPAGDAKKLGTQQQVYQVGQSADSQIQQAPQQAQQQFAAAPATTSPAVAQEQKIEQQPVTAGNLADESGSQRSATESAPATVAAGTFQYEPGTQLIVARVRAQDLPAVRSALANRSSAGFGGGGVDLSMQDRAPSKLGFSIPKDSSTTQPTEQIERIGEGEKSLPREDDAEALAARKLKSDVAAGGAVTGIALPPTTNVSVATSEGATDSLIGKRMAAIAPATAPAPGSAATSRPAALESPAAGSQSARQQLSIQANAPALVATTPTTQPQPVPFGTNQDQAGRTEDVVDVVIVVKPTVSLQTQSRVQPVEQTPTPTTIPISPATAPAQ